MPMILPAHAASAQPRAETALVREINRVRTADGLSAVKATRGLRRVARAHSLQMLAHDVLSHDSFTGRSFVARLSAAGPRRQFGETLAWAPSGAGSARSVIAMWLASAPHRAVLLDGRMRRIGIGRIRGVMGGHRGTAITVDWSS